MGFEPTHAFTRLLRFQHSLLSLLSNLPYLTMEPVGIEPTSKHLPTHFVYNHRLCIGFNFALTHNSSPSQASLSVSYQAPRQGLIVSRYY